MGFYFGGGNRGFLFDRYYVSCLWFWRVVKVSVGEKIKSVSILERNGGEMCGK